jgi:hypothetical protein
VREGLAGEKSRVDIDVKVDWTRTFLDRSACIGDGRLEEGDGQREILVRGGKKVYDVHLWLESGG